MISKRKRIAVAVTVLATVGIALGVSYWWRSNNNAGLFASGTVEATEAQLGFQVPGRIQTISVHEGDKVTKGQELARLDMTETRARLDQANARLSATEARLVQTGRDLERAKRLLAGGAIGQESFDKAQLARDVADSDHRQARAAIKTIQAMLDNMTIAASFNGLVTIRHREPGEVVPAGSPVLTVMNPAERWVRIYLPENRIGAIHVGEKATITTDTFPDKHYGGQVMFVASEAEFTPKNVQTTEERVKLVYAVKVHITEDPDFDLKPGIPADVHLEPGA